MQNGAPLRGDSKHQSSSNKPKVDGIVARHLKSCVLENAKREGRFQHIPSEYHTIETSKNRASDHRIHHKQATNADPSTRAALFNGSGSEDLVCLFQRTRPHHTSGMPDRLPFSDSDELSFVFESLALPESYLHISDGTAGGQIRSNVSCDVDGQPTGLELIAHCITRQGDWAMALSHQAKKNRTSCFWSVEQVVESPRLWATVDALKDLACHPMFLPCIMFAESAHVAVKRRVAIKSQVRKLEKAATDIDLKTLAPTLYATGIAGNDDGESFTQPTGIEALSVLLHQCRSEQSSREGRYAFWQSHHTALQDGMRYAAQLFSANQDTDQWLAHVELEKWISLTWTELESLRTRDIDYVTRVNNASSMLYNLTQQRDSRIQMEIGRASKRDSEDMKFIALLGSIFLPASLIATVLNVPEFQFLPGAALFGFYIAITIPLIGVVVTLCVARSYLIGIWRELLHRDLG